MDCKQPGAVWCSLSFLTLPPEGTKGKETDHRGLIKTDMKLICNNNIITEVMEREVFRR